MIYIVNNLCCTLNARNKNVRGKPRYKYYGSDSTFAFDKHTEWDTNPESALFANFLRCYALRNKSSFRDITSNHSVYYTPYINAKECRNMVTYFRDACKEKRIYMVSKEFGVKYEFWCNSDAWKRDTTMVIRQKKMSEKDMFLKALCDDGIRHINGKEKNFFYRVMKFMENSRGIWM